MKRILAALVIAVVSVVVKGIAVLDAVVFDPDADTWARYEEDGL